MRKRSIVIFIAAVMLAVPAGANLIVNGGFEDPGTTPPGGYITFHGGDSFLGWTVGGDSIDIHNTGHTQAYAGVQSLDLSGNAAGSITQTIATTPGATYELNFWYCAHIWHPYGGDAYAAIFWDGSEVDEIHLPASPDKNNMNWTYAEYVLTATSETTVLSFVSLSPNGGIILDEVTLLVPEPATLVLLGLGAMGLLRKRK
jgi:choice-of-anchor C domain-containing protein